MVLLVIFCFDHLSSSCISIGLLDLRFGELIMGFMVMEPLSFLLAFGH